MERFESIMKKFLEDYEKKDEDTMVKEFTTLKSLSQKYKETNRYPAQAGQLTVNRKKNRFKDILPFEYTRVALHPIEGVEGSDYINANYIVGSDGEIDYIAAQGPLLNTVNDFWRMLWYHNIEVVVMACREVEMGKTKCERYWPELKDVTKDYGVMKVTMTYEENVSNDFVIRDFVADCQGETQIIRQYHYNAWPDHGKPESPDPIIRMIEMMSDYRKHSEVPVVVHCSAGCGRTGTLIGIDIAKGMLLSKSVDPDFSVFKIVEKMRQQRPSMVQAKEQYLFVYMAIAELARRSIGMNPTLPPKPVTKPLATMPPKSYMNLNTSAFSAAATAAGRSRSPTPTSSPPPLQDTTDPSTHQYENVTQPPLPHKRSSRTEESLEESQHLPVPRRSPPMVKQKSVSNSHTPLPTPTATTLTAAANSVPFQDDSGKPAPQPKPRSRKSETTPSSSILPTPASRSATPTSRSATPTSRSATPSIANRPSTPTSRPVRSDRANTPEHAPNKAPPPKAPPKPLPKQPSVEEGDSTYSMVAMATNVGPDIMVVDELRKKQAPLKQVEEALTAKETSGGKKAGNIMDVFTDILGEDLINSVENKPPKLPSRPPPKSPDLSSRPLPLPPPNEVGDMESSASTNTLDDMPPEIPQRTDDRLVLVDYNPSTTASVVAPTYDVPGAMTSSTSLSLSHERLPPKVVVNDSTEYEEPSPLSIPVAAKPASPTSPSPSTTMPAPINRSVGGSTKRLFNKIVGGAKKESKKKYSSTEDLTALGSNQASGTARSAVSTSGSDISKTSRGSPSSLNIEDKYRFPGELGFGIRLERPVGPRQEPLHWKTISLPKAIKVT